MEKYLKNDLEIIYNDLVNYKNTYASVSINRQKHIDILHDILKHEDRVSSVVHSVIAYKTFSELEKIENSQDRWFFIMNANRFNYMQNMMFQDYNKFKSGERKPAYNISFKELSDLFNKLKYYPNKEKLVKDWCREWRIEEWKKILKSLN